MLILQRKRGERQALHRMQVGEVCGEPFDRGAGPRVVVRAKQIELARANIRFVVEQQREHQRHRLFRLPRGFAQAIGNRRMNVPRGGAIVIAEIANLMGNRLRRQPHLGARSGQCGGHRLARRCHRPNRREPRNRDVRARAFTCAVAHQARL